LADNILVQFTGVVALAVGAQWLAWRLKLPSILILLLFGFLAGPITGFLSPDALPNEILFPFVSLAVAIILFEGGLSLKLSELPANASVVIRLITLGAVATWIIGTLAGRYIVDLTWSMAILLGAILIVTGPTVVGPLLRQIRPVGRVGTILKWEGILIDPVGAITAVLVFEAVLQGELNDATGAIALGVLQSLVIGLVLGFAGAALLTFLLRQYWVPDNLQNPVTLMILVAAFALSNVLAPEAGLMTATVMGVVMTNQRYVSIRHIVEFKETLQLLLIGILFILLASRLNLDSFVRIGWQGLVFLAVMIAIARPVSVWLSTWGSGLSVGEKTFLSWMAPRGIVAASVASLFTFELAEFGEADAELLLPMTFLVIVGTVLFYSLTARLVARRLKLAEQNAQGVLIVGADDLGRNIALSLQDQGFRTVVVDTNHNHIRDSQLAGLEAHYGSAISEEVLEELEFTGIGRLLALTSNDEVNSLASLHFPEVFSRTEVYQLPMTSNGRQRSAVPAHLRGRFLFSRDATYDQLRQRLEEGYTVKATKITDQFSYADYQAHYQDQALPLFLVNERKNLIVMTGDNPITPRPGQTIISLVPEEQPAHDAR
jgi:NhaP-type Na+/H+ or K+/H+ antiporter